MTHSYTTSGDLTGGSATERGRECKLLRYFLASQIVLFRVTKTSVRYYAYCAKSVPSHLLLLVIYSPLVHVSMLI